MSKISEILNGWGGMARAGLGILESDKKVISENRLNICNECELRKIMFCGKCGCLITAKVLSMESTCPINKW
jgi:cytoskeletal protein CcmA (bactofilin family)